MHKSQKKSNRTANKGASSSTRKQRKASSSCLDGKSESKRTIVLIGNGDRLEELRSTLKDLKVTLKALKQEDVDVERSIDGACAVVVDALSAGGDPRQLLTELCLDSDEELKQPPCFVIVHDGMSDKAVRGLYASGAKSVFLWPSESPRLADLIAERLGIVFARGLTPERDAALSRTIRAHLRASAPVPVDLQVKTHRGVVELRGEVESLWAKRELESLVYDVPGVRRVVARDVRVPPTNRTDAEIEGAIRGVLAAASEIFEETIAASSRNGFVVLAGSVGDRSEVRRILELVTHVSGVRDIEFLATISPEARVAERNAAKRLKRGIDRLLHHGSVRVSVFGATAVLTGTVRDVTARGLVEKFVSRDNAIQRVVNKIDDQEL